jgi:hypothetical protein
MRERGATRRRPLGTWREAYSSAETSVLVHRSAVPLLDIPTVVQSTASPHELHGASMRIHQGPGQGGWAGKIQAVPSGTATEGAVDGARRRRPDRWAKMSTRSEPEGTLLFHAPSSRLVRLTGPGETLWSQMIAGERDINRLVDLHRQEAGVSAENAAFRVINFLAELRAEKFIDFRLPPGDEGAPFLDVRLLPPSRIEFTQPRLDGRETKPLNHPPSRAIEM